MLLVEYIIIGFESFFFISFVCFFFRILYIRMVLFGWSGFVYEIIVNVVFIFVGMGVGWFVGGVLVVWKFWNLVFV